MLKYYKDRANLSQSRIDNLNICSYHFKILNKDIISIN